MSESRTCPSGLELVPLRASLCPRCQGDLAVDVVLEGGDIGFRDRHELAKALARQAADDSSDQDWSGMTPPEPVDVPVQASGSVFLSLDAPDFDLSYAKASYLEVKLKLRGPGLAVVAIERLPFERE